MYVVELRFGNEPGRLEARPAHREKLTELHGAGKVLAAGPFADDCGALLIFDVADEAELEEILAADPYYGHPAVQVIHKREWSPLLVR